MTLQIAQTYASDDFSSYYLEGKGAFLLASKYSEQRIIPAFSVSWQAEVPLGWILATFKDSYSRMGRKYQSPRGMIEVEALPRGTGGIFLVKRAPVWVGTHGNPDAEGGGLELFLRLTDDNALDSLNWVGVSTPYHYLSVEVKSDGERSYNWVTVCGLDNIAGEVAELYMKTSKNLVESNDVKELIGMLDYLMRDLPHLMRR